MMTDDSALLRAYANSRSEEAFQDLVKRHLPLVYSVAVRKVGGDAHLAEDVAQTVFTDLARKASRLCGHPALTGWLFTSTHYAAAKAVRTEARRRRREQEAHLMETTCRDEAPEPNWERLRPLLDDLINGLRQKDREAVLLRFVEGQGYSEIGLLLGMTADGARSRVDRSLEKLKSELARRGVKSSASLLAGVLAGHTAAALPAGLGLKIATGALVGAASGGGFLAVFQLSSGYKATLAGAGSVAAGLAILLFAMPTPTAPAGGASSSARIQRLRQGLAELRWSPPAAAVATPATDRPATKPPPTTVRPADTKMRTSIVVAPRAAAPGPSKIEIKFSRSNDQAIDEAVELLVTAFEQRNPAFDISFKWGSTSTGVLILSTGFADVVLATRGVAGGDAEFLKKENIHIADTLLGYEACAVIVNQSNPLAQLTPVQLRDVFCGLVTNWRDVGGLSGGQIALFVAKPESTQRRDFERSMLSYGKCGTEAIPLNNDLEICQRVAADPRAVGHVGLSVIGHRGTKLLQIGSIPLTAETLKNKSYPYLRPVILRTLAHPRPEIVPFVNFCKSPEARSLLEKRGFVTVAP
jgi:RNA polymerase sigma factor (sigma-70 family)